jgi:hypothetical protein
LAGIQWAMESESRLQVERESALIIRCHD